MPDPPEHSDPGSDSLQDKLARRTRELQVLQRASEDLSTSLDLNEIYATALRTMGELFEFHHSIILLLDPGGETLQVVASRGYENQATGGRVRMGVGVIGLVAEKRKALYVANLGHHRAYAAAQRRRMVEEGREQELGDAVPVPGLPNAESHFAIPLLVRDELIGVFSIESPIRQTLSAYERNLVSIVANQIAIAIHNARLFEERAQAAQALKAANALLEVRVAQRTAQLERELRVAEELLSDARSRVEGPLLGESGAVRLLREAIEREASRPEPLLLVGPQGAGKEAVAHAIHAASGRTGAFIFVNCPETHTASRLAMNDTSTSGLAAGSLEARFLNSKFELASGGTLFLDAVHELPVECYAWLEAIVRGERLAADVRVIASTTQSVGRPGSNNRLDAIMRMLSRHRIVVPALIDRREDIPAIVGHFVHRLARQLGKIVTGVSPESMSRLDAYVWPGNIRELRAVLERAIMTARSSVLEIDEDLLDEGLAVGSYRLVSQIGSGGMGEVWLARHRLLKRPAAVKLIRPDVQQGAQHDQLVRRFQREAQVTSGLKSPHTVQLYDFGVSDTGSFYYVMELLNGFDLHTMITRFGPQPAERVVRFMRQACRSLIEAHAHGLVHRDIKPANLFITCLGHEYDYLKVVDFGIVRDERGTDVTLLSAQNLMQGTPAFMSPEVVLGESRLDGRADLYSLACCACFALTGRLLFPASTTAQMLIHHAQTRPTPPSQMSELPVPPELDDLLMACLEKNPDNRPPSAVALDDRLARVRLDRPWTDEQARGWWETHAPETLAADVNHFET